MKRRKEINSLMRRPLIVIVLGVVTWACSGRRVPPATESAPAFILGEFVDDYGMRYLIQADQWIQHPSARTHIREWHVRDRFLLRTGYSGFPVSRLKRVAVQRPQPPFAPPSRAF